MPPGTVIRSFAAPDTVPTGLAWDGRSLWMGGATSNFIYQIDPISGTTIRSFASPAGSPMGMAWDGSYLWSCDAISGDVHQIDPTSGTVVGSFASPGGEPRGLAWDGRTLWLADSTTDRIYQINSSVGTAIRSFSAPSTAPKDLAWDGRTLWNCDDGKDRIYQIDPISGAVIRSFAAPATTPLGLTWDGRTLWCTDFTTDLIYQLSVTPGASYADRVIATGPIAYWPGWEATGTIAFDISGNSPLSEQDGAYTGVTLAQVGIGDGRTSGLYDGGNDVTDIFTAAFQAAFNGAEGSLLVWGRVSGAGVWADGVDRRLVTILVDGNNFVTFSKGIAANTLDWFYTAGAVAETHTEASASVISFAMGMTWSKAAEEVRYYLDGAPLATDVTLGVWAGVPAAATTVIGAASTAPANVFDGFEAHAIAWDRPLSPAEMLSLGVL